MEYEIHGKPLCYGGGECGIYKSPGPIQRMEYATMNMNHLVNTINQMSVEDAIKAVTQLRDQAVQQAKWQHTPQNLGFPILIQHSGPAKEIDEVRGNIQNTERFCDEVLSALQGK